MVLIVIQNKNSILIITVMYFLFRMDRPCSKLLIEFYYKSSDPSWECRNLASLTCIWSSPIFGITIHRTAICGVVVVLWFTSRGQFKFRRIEPSSRACSAGGLLRWPRHCSILGMSRTCSRCTGSSPRTPCRSSSGALAGAGWCYPATSRSISVTGACEIWLWHCACLSWELICL